MDNIVVTGRGVVSPIASGVEAFFDALLGMKGGISDEGIAPCEEFDPETVMTPKEARRTDRFAQLAVGAADQAAKEAGLLGDIEPSRVGVIVGTGVGGLTTLQKECKTWLEEGDRAVSPLFVPMMMPNAAAGQSAMRLGLHGPGFSIASACSTGAHSIGEA